MKNNPFEKFCQQIVEFNENHLHMEALFKSMFNRNGHIEKDLCELDQASNCIISYQFDDCSDRCDCCQNFYTTKMNNNLKTIVCRLDENHHEI